MKSGHLFSRIPRAEIQRSVFNRKHTYSTTCNAGELIPIFCDEVLPGDTFTLNYNIFSRITTLIVPILDNLYFDTQFFFVPNRLVWSNFQKFMGEQENPGDSNDYLVPIINFGSDSVSVSSLGDYFGLPVGVPMEDVEVNALPFRAYNLIYNEWYRDENLIDSVTVNKGDGPDDITDYAILKRGKRHDYFTSCLPWPQKGPGVEIALGDKAPLSIPSATGGLKSDGSFRLQQSSIVGVNDRNVLYQFGAGQARYSSEDPMVPYLDHRRASYIDPETGDPVLIGDSTTWRPRDDKAGSSGFYYKGLKLDPDVYADLSRAQAVTINSLRTAFQLQKWQERLARGGSRYTEIIRSFFNVVSPDARLQRPEYLGGASSIMQINSVMQTSATSDSGDTTPQGNLSAYGVLGTSRSGFSKSFVEHGYIIGIMSIRSDLRYQQGLNKMWSRRTREDFYWPTFAHLGEQAVLNKEIYCSGDEDQDNEVFGYQERYAEYRYKPSMITGKLRSQVSDSLDVWHLAQNFEECPTLNKTFIEENIPMDRVLAVSDEPAFKVDVAFDLKCARPMPIYGTPGLVDHF